MIWDSARYGQKGAGFAAHGARKRCRRLDAEVFAASLSTTRKRVVMKMVHRRGLAWMQVPIVVFAGTRKLLSYVNKLQS